MTENMDALLTAMNKLITQQTEQSQKYDKIIELVSGQASAGDDDESGAAGGGSGHNTTAAAIKDLIGTIPTPAKKSAAKPGSTTWSSASTSS